jgi:hypothetical protein
MALVTVAKWVSLPQCESARTAGLVLHGEDATALEAVVVDVGTPTVPPMMRGLFCNAMPDYFWFDSSKRDYGYGAMEKSGFFKQRADDFEL